MRFCFIILCHLYLLSRLPFSRVIHSERIFHSTAVLSIVFQSKWDTDVFEFECCTLVFYSSFSAHNHYLCVNSILIVVVVVRAGLFTVWEIREWATYVFIYLFIFTLRYVIAPFRYLSRPPHQCCAGAGSARMYTRKQTFQYKCTAYQ